MAAMVLKAVMAALPAGMAPRAAMVRRAVTGHPGVMARRAVTGHLGAMVLRAAMAATTITAEIRAMALRVATGRARRAVMATK
jgi:hypothetical protein